ncbi:DNA alkylation repair protein [Flavobacterium glaciei]|uniref:3-methyladenine DNA glycosylase AlkD n=1 Tax=Flavobacterium glaciei TaxID=386300 RepID=A0A562PU12_9FLAO|nr:DNA alkylation repair protein [Flavobacterium glaciei]RDI55006.1 DNA-7-methylguanine glycosylase [Flavobacterium glaciei]TWI47914.1 3-methyladenine DNA glycosylase AlkD [Flavobacterium glaciei]
MNFILALENAFTANKNPENTFAMAKYMKNNFPFFGIKTEERRRIFKEIWKENKEEVSANARAIALDLYSKNEREFHYCAIEILIKELKGNYKKEDIQLIEKLITTNSWWDSVDTIAKYILGEYLLEFPLETKKTIERFSKSDNMWLHRSAILFQLGYKQKTNVDFLFSECLNHAHSKAFFIQKAIGWALREYAKSNPEAVKEFVKTNTLKPLSTKEALKNMC